MSTATELPGCDPTFDDCSENDTSSPSLDGELIPDQVNPIYSLYQLAVNSSLTVVGRAQILSGIVALTNYNETTGVTKLMGYINLIFGAIAVIYDFSMTVLSVTLA